MAFPGKVIEVKGDFARVDFGAGTVRPDVNVSLVEARVGQYVLVHAGYAMQVLDESEALKTIAYWNEILRLVPQDQANSAQYRGGL